MADYDLGTARGRIEIDADGVGRSVATANAHMNTLNANTRLAGQGMLIAGAAMVTGAAAIAAGLALAINAAANFEQRMSAIKAVSGATAEEMELLSDKALQLGADTAFSATESAGAMEELIKAGLTVEDVLNGAADATVNLAAAGEIDLTQAATIAANAMNAFNLAAQDLPHVADLIAGAANASAITVDEFGQSMQQSAAVANLAGLSFDDLAIAIAAMGNAGVRGSDAGTSLKTFLQNLQPVTQRQIDLFRELGIVTEDGTNRFYDATGSLKPLNEIAQVLQDSLVGMTDAEKQMALEVAFGSDAIRAAAIVADEGGAGFDALAAAMGNVTAQDVAETRMDNLKGSIERLKGSVETLLIRIGDPLINGVRAVVDAVTDAVNWITELDDKTVRMIGTVAAMTAGFLGGAGGVLIAVTALGKLTVALNLLRLALLANPITAIIALVLGLGVALYQLYQRNEDFRESVQQAFEWIRVNVLPVLEEMGRLAMEAFHDIAGFIQREVVPRFMDFVDFIVNDVIPVIQDIANFFMEEVVPAVIDVAQWFGWLGSEITERLGSAFEWMEQHVFPIFVALGELFTALGGNVRESVDFIIEAINFLQPVWSNIARYISFQITVIRAAIEIFVGFVQSLWRNFGDNLFAVIEFAWNTIRGIVEAALRVIQGVIQVITGIISGDWSKVWEGIRNIFGGIWDYIRQIPSTVMDFILLAIRNALDLILTIWQTVWSIVGTVVTDAWNGFRDTISGRIGDIISFVSGLPLRIVQALGSLLALLHGKGREVIDGMMNGIDSAFNGVINFMRRLPSEIVDAIGDLGRILYNAGRNIISGLIDGIGSMIGSVRDTLTGLAGDIVGWKGPPAKDAILLTANGQLIMQSLIDGIESMIPALDRMVSNIAPTINQQVIGFMAATAPAPAPVFITPQGSSTSVLVQSPVIRDEQDANDLARSIVWEMRLSG